MAPYGWECKARLVKQVPLKPTVKRPTKWDGFITPGPGHYADPPIYCGRGYSKIKRMPAYTFGKMTPPTFIKPAALPKAPMVDIRETTRKGRKSIPQGIIGELCVKEYITLKPGPGAHSPKDLSQMKRPPAYTMRIAAKPPYQPWDTWTPSSNMYCPPIPGKRSPAYSFGYHRPAIDKHYAPDPCAYDPKFENVMRSKPAYTLGYQFRPLAYTKTPAPNVHCEKRFLYSKPSAPAPSFGIRHSPYLGKQAIYEMPSQLELLAQDRE